MTLLTFLSTDEKRRFDSPPIFTKSQRLAYFTVTDNIRTTLGSMRTETNKVGFLLQLGYFKHSGKFFEKTAFRQRDIKFVKQLLNTTDFVDLAEYRPSRMTHHQSRILEFLDWTSFNAVTSSLIAEHVQLQAQQQIKPDQVFSAAVDFCWRQRIEIPSHHQLADVITDSFNIVESTLLAQLERTLSPAACDALDTLLMDSDGLRPFLSETKIIYQSLRSKDIQKNVDACLIFAQ